MAELADALDLGSSGLPVQVQVLSSAVSGLYGSLLVKVYTGSFFTGEVYGRMDAHCALNLIYYL